MSKGLFKIYVGNLDYKVTEFAVRRLFEPYGDLEDVAMATDKETGKPRGFAIVMMRDHDEAQKAISGVQGRRLMGRPLVVNEAVSKKGRKSEAGPGTTPASTGPRSDAAPQRTGGQARSFGAQPLQAPSRQSSGEGRPSSRNPRRSGGRNPRRSSPR